MSHTLGSEPLAYVCLRFFPSLKAFHGSSLAGPNFHLAIAALQCPPNSYYDPCMTGCPATCVDQHAPLNCSKPCVEGCACSSGFLLSGDTCVPEDNCGCHFEGNYYTVSENPGLVCRALPGHSSACTFLPHPLRFGVSLPAGRGVLRQ